MINLTTAKNWLRDQYGIEIENLEPIKSGVVNHNYKVATKTNTYLWKLNSHKNKQGLENELLILHHLEKNNFPSPKIVATKDGKYIHTYDGLHGWLYNYIDGDVPKIISDNQLKKLGQLLAELHTHCKNIEQPNQKTTWDPKDLINLIKQASKEPQEQKVFNDIISLGDLQKEVAKFKFDQTLPIGITHQDIKPENIILQGEEIVGIVDFDNSYRGTLLHDITTTIIWTCFEKDQLKTNRIESLLSGYQKVRPLEEKEKQSLWPAICFRLIREVFISPYAATRVTDGVKQRAKDFLKKYNHIKKQKEFENKI